MSGRSEAFLRVEREFEDKHSASRRAAEARRLEAEEKIPELRSIDSALAATGFRMLEESIKGELTVEERAEKMRKENELLLKRKAELLVRNGYPADYTDEKYECPICKDRGYTDKGRCVCFKKALVKASLEASGLGALTEKQSFETFDVTLCGSDAQTAERAKLNYEKCREFASSFSGSGENLLMVGGTGLGKTHLSTSIARVAIEDGHSVVYEPAQTLIRDLEREYFRREDTDTDRFFDCDLLIIDDLGTEMKTEFSISCIYNVINTRLNAGKSMIINTNLSQSELRARYADRITSRLFGSFTVLAFKGKDVRLRIIQ